MTSKACIALTVEGMGLDAHLTLIFAGNVDLDRHRYIQSVIDHLGPINEIVERTGFAVFGPPLSPVPVVTVEVPDTIRHYRERLLEYGIESASEWDWNPHITLKTPKDPNETLVIPPRIKVTGPWVDVWKES